MAKDIFLRVGSIPGVGGALTAARTDPVGLVDFATAVLLGTSRDSLVYDTYRPTNQTAGFMGPLADLDEYNLETTDNVTFAVANQTIENKIIYGRVNRAASGVHFNNCLFVGPRSRVADTSADGWAETAVVNCNDTTYSGWVLTDCTIAPRFPNAGQDCIKSNNFKLFRCHLYHGVDGVGIFSNSPTPANGSTNVEVAGCLIEDNVYYGGTNFSNFNDSNLTTGGTYSATGTFVVRRTAVPADIPYYDPGHNDGNHNDGIQVQGTYGRMVRTPGTEKWTGDGTYIHGNTINSRDALGNNGRGTDRSGKGLVVPGEAGSLPGSNCGLGDNPKRGVAQSPTMTRPVLNGAGRLPNGDYSTNGCAIIFNMTTNNYPYPSTAFPNDYSVVAAFNHIGVYHAGIGVPDASVAVKVGILYNTFSEQVFNYNCLKAAGTTPSIYPIRFSGVSGDEVLAPTKDGQPGLPTNKWDDPTNRFGRNGQSLVDLGTLGNIGGITHG